MVSMRGGAGHRTPSVYAFTYFQTSVFSTQTSPMMTNNWPWISSISSFEESERKLSNKLVGFGPHRMLSVVVPRVSSMHQAYWRCVTRLETGEAAATWILGANIVCPLHGSHRMNNWYSVIQSAKGQTGKNRQGPFLNPVLPHWLYSLTSMEWVLVNRRSRYSSTGLRTTDMFYPLSLYR